MNYAALVLVALAAVTSEASATIQRFGEDLDGNGIPDRIDLVLRNEPEETRKAAENYLRHLVKLADRVLNGDPIEVNEKQKIFFLLACHNMTAKSENHQPLNLDDLFRMHGESFSGLYRLMGEVSGTGVVVRRNKDWACAEAAK